MTRPRIIGHADARRRHWLLTVILLAAAIGLCVSLAAVLWAYGQSDYGYLTCRPALSATRGFA
jgi:hypothetical protein